MRRCAIRFFHAAGQDELTVANQKTIGGEVSFRGRALQTGRKTAVVCVPAPAGHGIVFERSDLAGSPSYNLRDAVFSEEYARRSTVGLGAGKVQTVEHLLAALWGLGIDNMLVRVNGPELPVMDGSAEGFLKPLKEAGLVEQEEPRREIKITSAIRVEDGKRSITALPGEGLTISYLIDYKVRCVGREIFEIKLDGDSFEKEIAPARTFCMKREALLLLLAGLGRGANLKNTLVLGDKGPVGTSLRFPNEPVRHKILDLVGDLYMLGRPVIGKIIAERSGHALNARLVRRIYEDYLKGGK